VGDVSAPPSLTVDLNRERIHDVEAADAFETTGSFAVVLDNHGEAVHVHLHLDDELSRVASVAAGNHYVEAGDRREVQVRVRPGAGAVTGRLKVVTGYGSETAYVAVTVRPEEEHQRSVAVDERLARPQTPDERPGAAARLASAAGDASAPFVALAALAVALAALAAMAFPSAAVFLGVGVVVAAVAGALWLLWTAD
jgi:hypothetical protein